MRSNEEFNREVFARANAYRKAQKNQKYRLFLSIPTVLCAIIGVIALSPMLSRMTTDGADPESMYGSDNGFDCYLDGATGALFGGVTGSTVNNGSFAASYSWVNWSEDGEEALREHSASRDKDGLPVVKITSEHELDEFLKLAGEHFAIGQSYNKSKPFTDNVKDCGSEFFRDRCLFIIYIPEGSGSIRHKVTDASGDGDTLSVTIRREVPGICTDDMAGWFITLTMDTEEAEQYSSVRVIIE